MKPTEARRSNLTVSLGLSFATLSMAVSWAQDAKAPLQPSVLPAKTAATKVVPRTKDGHPDLDGIWTNVTLTPLERPDEFAGEATATDDEAAKYEDRNISRERTPAQRAAQQGVGGYNALFIDKGTQARQRAAARAAAAQTYSGHGPKSARWASAAS